ncbi:zinc finger protein 14-like [Parasteatoda tepidariorum]|uniref:zinc finger protein 14-like n=1 Tax=Parasteatoda tepidariorum TaxID=114398 RepID=UPI00077FA9DA|nr:zinc finger protein 883-like [Parasteatoda tepidariorum]
MSSNFTEKPIVEVLKITNQQHSGRKPEFHVPKPLICFVCGTDFVTDKDLQQHYVEHIAVKPYKCKLCDKSFISERNLKKHETKHAGLKPYQCDICKRKFSKKLKYEIQCRTHGTEQLCVSCCELFSLNDVDDFIGSVRHDCDTCNQRYLFKPVIEVSNGHLKPYLCTICGKSFSNRISLTNHSISHKEQRKRFSCNICYEAFPTLHGLDKHEKSHIQINVLPDGSCYPCKLCYESFTFQHQLESHYNDTHFGEFKYECNICKRNVFLHHTLHAHVKTHVEQKHFKCRFCPRTFTSKTYLRIHHLVHDSTRKFECGACGKRFSTNVRLKLHGIVHMDKKPFKCVDCHFGFNNKTYLKRHYLKHIEEKPYKCDKCPISFTRKIALQKHEFAHKSSDEYKCQNCFVNFISFQDLHNHYRVKHPRTKPYYICYICLKVIRHKQSFFRHCRLHTNDRPFKCKYCDKKYTLKYDLHKHHKNCHPNLKIKF